MGKYSKFLESWKLDCKNKAFDKFRNLPLNKLKKELERRNHLLYGCIIFNSKLFNEMMRDTKNVEIGVLKCFIKEKTG